MLYKSGKGNCSRAEQHASLFCRSKGSLSFSDQCLEPCSVGTLSPAQALTPSFEFWEGATCVIRASSLITGMHPLRNLHKGSWARCDRARAVHKYRALQKTALLQIKVLRAATTRCAALPSSREEHNQIQAQLFADAVARLSKMPKFVIQVIATPLILTLISSLPAKLLLSY